MAAERRRKRNALLDSTEADAAQLAAGYAAGRYDRDEFNRRLGGLRRRRMGKHFAWVFDERTEEFGSQRKQDSIEAEERLDGIYVIRTNLEAERLSDEAAVRAYKRLARVERAFRSMKSLLAPLLFVDEDKAEGAAGPVGPAQRSATDQRKERTRQTLAGSQPLHSFEDLLEHLAGLTVAEFELEVRRSSGWRW